ncbi:MULTISPECIES: hypothetical protein [unclassified Chryseobacterium]|uniref:hypothetical protein n=1 Tax=unclassified Chryseobacterium TaxID=2593645 RepID=UPI001ADFEEBA|nr:MULTISPECIES: hypothetical protein [unclassified Chryseobacterium]
MKTKLLILIVLSAITGCTHSAKESENNLANNSQLEASKDETSQQVFTDRYGEKMEITRNLTKNTIALKLDGKSYSLHKNHENNGYSTSDNQYQLIENKKTVTFLKKDVDMVLFQSEKDSNSEKIANQ